MGNASQFLKMICATGLHAWEGCRCRRCHVQRNQEHDWDGCRCRRCGNSRDVEHRWRHCQCERCRVFRDKEHQWAQGCKCICGKLRNEAHDWNGCRCKTCGATGPSHPWAGFRCQVCSTFRYPETSIVGSNATGLVARFGIRVADLDRIAHETGIGDQRTTAIELIFASRGRKVPEGIWSDVRFQEGVGVEFASTQFWGNQAVLIVQILSRHM